MESASRWLGIGTCVVCALPILVGMARDPAAVDWRRLAWLVLLVAFLACLWAVTNRPEPPEGCRRGWGGLALLSALAIGMSWLVPYSLMGVYLVIVAGGLGEVLALGGAAAWIVAQSALFTLPMVRAHGAAEALVIGAAFVGFQLFALYAANAAERARRGRAALARVNAELVATRRLLVESSRNAERLRIARDLHDVLGHHLTALSLHLEAARHAPPEGARQAVEAAHGIAGGLLAEVRGAVGRLRDDRPLDDRPLDLPAALAELAAGVERPRVHLVLGDGFGGVPDPERAEALLRCAQEMLTNAIRHSQGDNVWIELRDGPDGVELTARDDGRGVADGERAAGTGGTGLAGMRERLERLGGRLAVDRGGGRGFTVSAWLPAAAAGAEGE